VLISIAGQRASKPDFMMALLKRSRSNWQASSTAGVPLEKGKRCEGRRRLVDLSMIPTEGHGEVLDFGRVKTHERTGAGGQVVDEISPRDPRFSQYRLVLELNDGTRRDFLFLELRDATEQEIVGYESARAQSRPKQ